jgi:hypothetical protein
MTKNAPSALILIAILAANCPAQRDRGPLTFIVTEAGAYTVPNLPIGIYQIEAEAPGFKKLERGNIRLEMAQVLRVDLSMEVGAVTESIAVTAELSRVETETPRVQATMDNASVRNVPRTFTGNDRARTIEGWIYSILPGAVGTPQTSYINGINSSSTKLTLLDGAPGGAQAGGIITESSYGAIKNEFFNANTFVNNFFGRPRDPDRKYNYAFRFGGPIYIPKVYNGKDKTFFYFTYERYIQHLFSNGIIQGTIYDPATLRLLPGGSGRYIADPFFGNIVPKSRFSTVSQNVMKVGVPRWAHPRPGPSVRAPSARRTSANGVPATRTSASENMSASRKSTPPRSALNS